MATETTVAQLTGLYKEAYANGIVDLVPEAAYLLKKVPFAPPKQRMGNFFHQPVIVSDEQGFTYYDDSDGAPTLNDSESMAMQDAQLSGFSLVGQATVAYSAAAKADTPNAFKQVFNVQMANLVESIGKRIELGMLYGQSGIGLGDSSSNVDATTTDVTFTAASWATGIWSGLKNAKVNFWTAGGAIVSSGADAIFTVGAVTPSTRVVRFTGTATGISALDTALGAGDCDAFFAGSRTASTTYKEMAGINKIITNTGTLFGIDAAVYDLWQGNTYAVGGTLTQAHVNNAVARACSRGLAEDAVLLVNPDVWADLLAEQVAQRMFDSSYKPSNGERGNERLTFHSQNGKLDVVSHMYVKTGDAFILPTDRVKRTGATDVTFETPGRSGEIFFQHPSKPAWVYRCYSHQAILIESPSRTIKLTGITS